MASRASAASTAAGNRLAPNPARRSATDADETLAEFLALSSDWLWEQDADLRFTHVGPAAEHSIGIPPAEFTGRARWDIPGVSPFRTSWEEHRGILASRKPFRGLLLRCARPDGAVRYVAVSGQPVFDARGIFQGYRGIARDITTNIAAEISLRESEQRFRETFDQAAVGITHHDSNGMLLNANRKFCDMLGYPKDELLGKCIQDITHPEDYGKGFQYRAQLLRGEIESAAGEKRFVRKDGTIMWARRTMSLARDLDGKSLHLITVVEDITEGKKLAEQEAGRIAQLKRLAELGMLLGGDPAVVFERTVRMIGELFDVRVVCLSEIVDRELFFKAVYVDGKVMSDAGRCPLDITPCATVEKNKDIQVYDRVMERFPQATFLRDHNTHAYCGFPALDGDGRVVAVTCLLDDKAREFSEEDRQILRIIGQRVATEVERGKILAERARLGAIVAGSNDAIVSRDLDGKVFSWNAAAERMFGYTAADAIGRNINFITPPDLLAEVMEKRALLAKGHLVPPYDTVRLAKDGRRIDVSVTLSTIKDASGRVIGVSPVFRDITERKRADAERAQVAAIVENSHDAIFSRALDGTIVSWNAGAERMLGYTAAEAIGRPASFTLTPDRKPNLARNTLRMLRGEMVPSHESRRMAKDGRVIDVMTSHSPLRDSAGRIIGASVILQDISALKQAEAALRESEERLRAAFEQAGVGMGLRDIDPRNPHWLRVNQKLCDILGYTCEELLRLTTLDITPPEDRQTAIDFNERLRRGNVTSYQREKRYVRKDGRVIWVNLSLSAVRGADGHPSHVLAVVEDVTERRNVGAERERLAAIVENSSDAVISRDLDRKVLTWNAAAERMFGYSGNEAIGRTDEFIVPEDRVTEAAEARALIAKGIPVRAYDTVRLTKGGQRIDVSASPSPLRDPSGRMIGISLVFRDIGERKKMERSLELGYRARKVLAESALALARATSEKELLKQVCRIVVNTGGYVQAWVGYAGDDERKSVLPVASAGFEEGYLEAKTNLTWAAAGQELSLTGLAIATGRIHVTRDILTDPDARHLVERARARGYRSSISLPLHVEGRLIGGFSIYAHETDAFDEEEVNLLKTLAAEVSFGISSLRADAARHIAVAALQESEERLRSMFEQAAVGITRANLDGILLEVNETFCAMLGYSRAELVGTAIKDITHTDDYGKGAEIREQLVSDAAKSMSGEKRFIRKDGNVLWTRRTMSAVRDASSHPHSVISIVEDISERKSLEMQFQNIFEQAAVGIAHVSMDGVILRANGKFGGITGYTTVELVGMRPSALSYPDDAGSGESGRRLLLEGKVASHSNEKRYIRKDGTVIWVNRTESVARDDSGRPLYFIRVIDDISERKLAERAIEENEAILSGVVDSALEAVIATDDQSRIMLFNPAAERVFLRSADEVLGKSMDVLLPERFRSAHARHISQFGSSDQSQTRDMSGRRTILGLRSTNEEFPCEVTISRHNRSGQKLLVAFLTDVSEREATRAALKQSEARYQLLAEHAQDLICLTMPDGEILYASPSARTLLGYDPNELVGSRFQRFVDPADTGSAPFWQPAASGARSKSQTFRTRARNGHQLWLETQVEPVFDGAGNVTGFVTSSRDVSARKQSEQEILALNASLEQRVSERTRELESVNRELEAFSYSVSHDLRAPLRAISGFSELLLRRSTEHLDPTSVDYLKRIHGGTVRMGQLIDDLLRLSRISRHELHRETFDASRLADAAIGELRHRFPERRVEAVIEPGMTAFGDPGLVRVAFDNLLGNAWKFTARAGTARIEVGISATGRGRALFIRDNGAGFNMKYAHKLFAPFQRLHRSADFEGTGIGLAIVRRIVRLHDGEIWAESEVGKGATFYLSLPSSDDAPGAGHDRSV